MKNETTGIPSKIETAGTIEFNKGTGALSLSDFMSKLQQILFSIPKDITKENVKIFITDCLQEDGQYWTFPSLTIQYVRPLTETEEEERKAAFNNLANAARELRYEKYLELKAEFDKSNV